MTSAHRINQPVRSRGGREATFNFPDGFDLSKSRETLIREVAYLRASRRGFRAGHELEDWLAAEQQVNEYLAHEIPLGFYG